MKTLELIEKVSSSNLSQQETVTIFQDIFLGKVSDQKIEDFLINLTEKGETSDELTGAVLAMRSLSVKVNVKNQNNLVDCCGTGGLGKSMMNVSTSAAFVAAAAKVKVAKHGNRTATGKSGSADLLEAANLNLNLTSDQVAKCIEEIGIGFIFAQNFHPGMKYVMPARKRIANKTIFNLLGPLTNPASAKRQSLGVYDSKWILPVAETLKNLGAHKALVFHSNDGLDEISSADKTLVAELNNGNISEYEIDPKAFDVYQNNLEDLQINSPSDSLKLVQATFRNDDFLSGKNITALNSAAVIYVSGQTDNFSQAFEIAMNVLESGKAQKKLDELISFSRKFDEST